MKEKSSWRRRVAYVLAGLAVFALTLPPRQAAGYYLGRNTKGEPAKNYRGKLITAAIAAELEKAGVKEVEALPNMIACLVGTPALRVLLLCWPGGFATVPHVHPAAEEIFLVIGGRALFTIGDEPEREVGPGAFMFARRGIRHAIRVPDGEPLLLLASVAPNEDRPDETVESA